MTRLHIEELETRLTPADLRIVTYNITASDGTVRSGFVGNIVDSISTNDHGILDTIGVQTANGITRPADVILLQETDTGLVAVNTVTALLNSYYGANTYVAGTKVGATTGGGTQGIIYKASTVDLLESVGVGTTSTSGMPRQPLRYRIRPDNTTTDIYLYNSHMKSDTAASDVNRRLIEAQTLRSDADALPAGANILYAGDYNLYSSNTTSEPAYAHFLTAGNGKAMDVANPAGNWVKNTNSFVSLYTQAPANAPPAGLVGGGLDDRFDFIFMSTELSDSSGLEYRTGTYRPFGNNGSLPVNSNINDAGNTALALTTPLAAADRTTVLNFLTTASDHLPVVADFTFPSGPTAVSSYAVNGGTQRSMVKNITVTFNAAVPAALTASNFAIAGFAGTINVAHTAGSTTAVISFSGTGTQNTSLSDGLYTLTVTLSGLVTNTTFSFHRLFGDANADRTLDATDFAGIGTGFGQSVVNSPYDYDNNGTIDALDLGQFGVRFGKTI